MPSAVDIIIDSTDSMYGFAQSPALTNNTAYVRVMNRLAHYATTSSKDANVNYYRTDVEVVHITEKQFNDIATPAFYIPRIWYDTRDMPQKNVDDYYTGINNIASAIEAANQDNVTMIVTDLFENRDSNSRLTKLIKQKYLRSGGTAVVIAIMSEFDGYVYDVFQEGTNNSHYYLGVAPDSEEEDFVAPTYGDINKWQSAVSSQGKDAEIDFKTLDLIRISDATPAMRPFYIIMLGKANEVIPYADECIKSLEGMEGRPVDIKRPILKLEESGSINLTGTEGIGAEIIPGQNDLIGAYTTYFEYNDPANYQSDVSAAEVRNGLPENMLCYLHTQNSSAGTLTLPITLTLKSDASAEDEALAQRLYDCYSLSADAVAYPLAETSYLLDDGEGRRNGYIQEAASDSIKNLVELSGGNFTCDPSDPSRATATLYVTLNLNELPDASKLWRLYIKAHLYKRGSMELAGVNPSDFPWVSELTLSTGGMTEEDWDANPSMRVLNKTVNLDFFVEGLINSSADVAPAETSQFPDDTLVNTAAVDICIKG